MIRIDPNNKEIGHCLTCGDKVFAEKCTIEGKIAYKLLIFLCCIHVTENREPILLMEKCS